MKMETFVFQKLCFLEQIVFLLFLVFSHFIFFQLLVLLSSIAWIRPDMHCQWVSGVMGG